MQGTQRNRKGIRHFAPQSTGLREFQVMRFRRLPAADQTGMCGDKNQVIFVAQPFHLRDGQEALVNGLPLGRRLRLLSERRPGQDVGKGDGEKGKK